MSTSNLILPKPTTANERIFGFSVSDIRAASSYLTDHLQRCEWLFVGGFLYQPLFGLTAKTIDGKERTVVEGDVVINLSTKPHIVSIVTYRDFSFGLSFCYNKDGLNGNEGIIHSKSLDQMWRQTILSHCTDIVAKGNKLECWECTGKKYIAQYGIESGGRGVIGSHQTYESVSCPTCHGAGQFNVIWE